MSYLSKIKLTAAQKKAITANNRLSFLDAITRERDAKYVPAAQQFVASIGTKKYKRDPWYTTNSSFEDLVNKFKRKSSLTGNPAAIDVFVHIVATFMAACKGKPSASKNVLEVLDGDPSSLYNLGFPNFYAIVKRKYGPGEFGRLSNHYQTLANVIAQTPFPDIIIDNGTLNPNSSDYPIYLILVKALRSLFHNCKLG